MKIYMKTRLRNRSWQEGGGSERYRTELQWCNVDGSHHAYFLEEQQEIQGDKANEEFNGIDSAENGSGNDGNIDDSLLRSPDKDISDEDQSIIYDFSKQNAVYSNDALLYFFNREGNRLECEKRIVISAQADDYLKRVVEHLALGPKLKGLEPVIPKGL